MTKAKHLKMTKDFANLFAKNVRLRLNLMGLEAAILANFGITVSRPTLEAMLKFYSHSRLLANTAPTE